MVDVFVQVKKNKIMYNFPLKTASVFFEHIKIKATIELKLTPP